MGLVNNRGFCIFNNCVLAAHSLKEKYGAKRVCIVDWDVHHGKIVSHLFSRSMKHSCLTFIFLLSGNGIQRAFLRDGEVLYISLHRYDNATFYPHSQEAAAEVVGAGAGTGR